jgi:hypothetical protein
MKTYWKLGLTAEEEMLGKQIEVIGSIKALVES